MRVTNMKDVDVNTFDFNFDLTFAALLLHADGTILHTYAGRDATDPESHLTMPAFVEVLEKTLPEHAAYAENPNPRKRPPPQSVDQMPWMKRRPKQPDCYHCHNVYDARLGELRDRGRYKRRDAWTWPDPIQVGMRLHKEQQTRLTEVVNGSAAAKAGLRKGDRLVRLGAARVLTFGDVQRVLHEAGHDPVSLPVTYMRGGKKHTSKLALGADWRVPDPTVFAWRATKWPMRPQPGFGGRPLGRAEKRKAGIATSKFAFEIRYLVTWGENAHTGRNAVRAGLRKHDIVVAVAGKSDFESMDHYHAWFRFTQKPGSKVAVKILRKGVAKTIQLPVVGAPPRR